MKLWISVALPFQVLSSLRVAYICPRTFDIHQTALLQPTILWQWRAEQQRVIAQAMQSGSPVTLGGDMRADSPGLSLLMNLFSIRNHFNAK